MKRFFASFLTLSLLIVSCNFFSPKPNPSPTPDPFAVPWNDRSPFKNGLVESEQHVLDELEGTSIYHLEFTIADDLYEITGTEEVQYTNMENVALDKVELRLFPNILGGEMKISNLTVNDQTVTPDYGLKNSLMIIPLPKPIEPKQSIILKMNYTVTVPQTVDLNYGVLAYYDNVLALAHSYPMICVYDDEGWNAELPPQDGDITFADAAFYLVKIHAPKRLTLVTTGRNLSLHEEKQAQVLTVASGPARDFYLVASPYFEKVSRTFGEVTINSYAPKQSRQGAQVAVEVASKAIRDYGRRYAPYPYTELDFVSTPNLALGIEYPGMIALTTRIYSANNDYMEATVAHEVGHQWFYNLVGDDQLDDPWLDESLAQFATLQYYADEYGTGGENGFRSSLESRWQRVNNQKIPIGLPVASYHGGEYGAIVYGRGPLFFVALRTKMGTDAFNAFLKDYTTSLSWKIATPKLLQATAEKHCGCDLQGIFDEWVYP